MKAPERQQWAEKVLIALRQNSDLDFDEFVFLAGKPYRQYLLAHIRHYTVPMEGLAFGKQLQWLRLRALERARFRQRGRVTQ
jgi:hypothetical protein